MAARTVLGPKSGGTPGEVSRPGPACCAIAHTPAVEDYLKYLVALSNSVVSGDPDADSSGCPDSVVGTGALARELAVAPSSVTAMMDRLVAHGLVDRRGRGRVRLTAHGRSHGLVLLRRHRLVETYLCQVLGVPADEVHREAEVLEHAVSQALEDRMDDVLGHPRQDPHGSWIPPRSVDGPDVEQGRRDDSR